MATSSSCAQLFGLVTGRSIRATTTNMSTQEQVDNAFTCRWLSGGGDYESKSNAKAIAIAKANANAFTRPKASSQVSSLRPLSATSPTTAKRRLMRPSLRMATTTNLAFVTLLLCCLSVLANVKRAQCNRRSSQTNELDQRTGK